VGEPVGCHGAPGPQVLERCVELGRKLAESA
jgi:hypothetical protein